MERALLKGDGEAESSGPTSSASEVESTGEPLKGPETFDAALLSDFLALYRNTLSYKNTRNIRNCTEVALRGEEAACTFNPEIDSRSRRIADRVQDSGGDSSAPRYDMLYDQAKAIEAAKELDRVRTAEAKMSECTFKPKVNKSKNAWAAANAATSNMGGARFEYLHSSNAKKDSSLSTTELEVVQECTFKPQITQYEPPREKKTLPGFEKAVERLRRPGEERAQREADEEEAAARKAATNAAFKGPQPFSFQTEKRSERKQPLLYMDVNLGPGKTGRIGLHQGDDAEMLAANFARTYQLDAAMTGRLQQLIEKYMAEVLPSLAAQAATSPGNQTESSMAPATEGR